MHLFYGFYAGGDVWVLVIKAARPMDSGTYICEINSNPILRSFHSLFGTLFISFREQKNR